MKLVALFNAFNNAEMLVHSVEKIRPHVDEILICISLTSHYGEKIDKHQIDIIKSIPKIHHLPFIPKMDLDPHSNSRLKVQLRLNWAKQHQATHYLLMAEDHFYEPEQFEWAKKSILSYDPDVTVTKMYTYFKKPTWQLDPIEDYSMPFISKLYPETRVVLNSYPDRTDPSVRVNTSQKYLNFHQDEVMLHHFSMVRENIRSKLSQSAASQNWPEKIEGFVCEYQDYDIEKNPGVRYFGGRKIKVVPNYFKL